MKKIYSLKNRLSKIGIDLEFQNNFPWVYLHKVNGNIVKEKHLSDYGFTVTIVPARVNQKMKLTNISEIFKIIRKYR